MKYIKGTQTWKIDDARRIKVRLKIDSYDPEELFVETPWIGVINGEKESVLLNNALSFLPYRSWGAILPTTGRIFNPSELIEKGELVLHPEAWDQYLENGGMDKEGNAIISD